MNADVKKTLVYLLCALTLLGVAGCGTVKTAASASAEPTPAAFVYDGSIISGMLDRIIASSDKVDAVPVTITSAQLVRQGCLIHFDRLAYNENYKRGSTDPGEAYLLNEEELDEQATVANANLHSDKVKSAYLDKSFVEYIASKKSGASFTLYWLDGQIIFVSEIKMPS